MESPKYVCMCVWMDRDVVCVQNVANKKYLCDKLQIK